MGYSQGEKNIFEANKFIKFATGGTTHNRRLLSNDEMFKIRDVEIAVPIISQPVCEHCERLGLWHSERDMWGQIVPICYCEHCGTITKKPLTYGEYLANGYDIPANIVGRDREDSIKARQMLNAWFNVDGKDNRDEVFQ